MQADQDNITRRLKIVRGQVDGLLKMVEEDRYCVDISNQVLAIISALKSINVDILTAHLSHCVTQSLESQDPKDIEEKMREMEGLIKKISK